MSVHGQLVDEIVARVLRQLETAAAPRPASAPRPPANSTSNPLATELISANARGTEPPRASGPTLDERVITADILQARVNGAQHVTVGHRALLTPSALDYIRQHGIDWSRAQAGSGPSSAQRAPQDSAGWQILVSRSSESVVRLVDEFARQPRWQAELVDDWRSAGERAVSALSRAEAAGVVVLTASPAALACDANRNRRIRAAVVRDVNEIRQYRDELNPNLLCLDPGSRSYFELRNLFRAVDASYGSY